MSELSFDELKPKVVLGIAAHPDDLDFAASGAFARWAHDGAKVYYLILTDGSKGSDDPVYTPEKLIKTREEEQKKAARIVGAKDVYFLNYPDAYLEITLGLKKDITHSVRKLKPDVVVSSDPSNLYSLTTGFINHSDHRAAGQATIDAVFPMARDRLTFPEHLAEGLEPHKVPTLLLINSENSNYYVDISNYIDKKMLVIAAHASQVKNIEETQDKVKIQAKKIGGKMGVNYGESFIRLDLPE